MYIHSYINRRHICYVYYIKKYLFLVLSETKMAVIKMTKILKIFNMNSEVQLITLLISNP